MISPTSDNMDLAALTLQKPTQEEESNLGQEDFLALMIEQFTNQDPFEPMENGEFIAQMAQFSQVSGIADMSASLERLSESLSSNQALQASTMVGRSVLADGNLATLGTDTPLQGGVNLPYETSAGFVRVFNGTGQPIRDIPLGNRNSGLTTFQWDGMKPDGTRAEAGTYRVGAFIRNNGIEEPLDTLVSSKIQSVTLSAGGRSAQLTTEAGAQVSLSQVKAIM